MKARSPFSVPEFVGYEGVVEEVDNPNLWVMKAMVKGSKPEFVGYEGDAIDCQTRICGL